ncbi:MFS transporter [Caldimonas thermodepolymerans]|uniref:MFS transporter n=1 Tax=Caldimonas thermodepolymerans TaxID=215580 RepID=A0A2S5T1Z0_9BURK|nr:MFS transporter [Caldimonas thermodepolymerans]PPE69035.1 MFS transporter [Caldimonas thermodepolymerans]QPC32334.1 MFS transporter [Caldimonas thermodepolymerans]RDH98233.1 nitrate/nitrite transporter NarK [Caldimonas thermodepolymerans]TCP07990.1 nitrate/nitrite transporter NarK [Caldimonas thermodepolymerans]UZG48884.1 MFS transporter [Caldimonas thermodepolymerans]
MSAASSRLSGALVATLVAASFISLMSFGVRAAFGLFTAPLPPDLGITREAYSLAIAVQNLCWGVTQPFAGHLTDRFGARRVMLVGALLYLAGILGLMVSGTALHVLLSAGVLVGVGMGGASFSTALAALGRVMPESHRSWALGVGTAAGSLGQFVIVPLVQACIDLGAHWSAGAGCMAAGIASILVAAWFVREVPAAGGAAAVPAASARTVLGGAFAHRSYVWLVLGFFVCGFQLAFITTHFPAYLGDLGVSASLSSWAVAMIGLFNVLGAYLAGTLGGRWGKKPLLVWIYLVRGALIAGFVLLPVSTATVLGFGAGMGLLWLSTVPLTSGLVATFFGTRYMGMLFGIAFFSHQVGSFLGVSLAGAVYQRTGSYDAMWWGCVALSLLAAVANLPVREQPAERFLRLAGAR